MSSSIIQNDKNAVIHALSLEVNVLKAAAHDMFVELTSQVSTMRTAMAKIIKSHHQIVDIQNSIIKQLKMQLTSLKSCEDAEQQILESEETESESEGGYDRDNVHLEMNSSIDEESDDAVLIRRSRTKRKKSSKSKRGSDEEEYLPPKSSKTKTTGAFRPLGSHVRASSRLNYISAAVGGAREEKKEFVEMTFGREKTEQCGSCKKCFFTDNDRYTISHFGSFEQSLYYHIHYYVSSFFS